MNCVHLNTSVWDRFLAETFVPVIAKSAGKNVAVTGKISPLVSDVILPGSCTLIFTPATASFWPVTTHFINGLRGIFDRISDCSLFGNCGRVSFCGYMRNNFQRLLFTTTKAYPSRISDCGGKNFTSMEIKFAALKVFEAGCAGKFIAALTDSIRKFKKYSRKSGFPFPMPKSSAIIVGIDDDKTLLGAFPQNVNVACFDPQLVESGIESHCVKSGKTLPFTRSFTNALMFKTGRFSGSILAIWVATFLLSCSSFHASANPIMTSAAIPTIKIRHPHFAFACCHLKSLAFLNFSTSIPLSSKSPINTKAPPIAANAGHQEDGIDSIKDDNFISSPWGHWCGVFLSVWFFGMFLVTPLENLFFRWWDKNHPPIIH